MTTITVCMGSSCFSRGNSLNADYLQKFLEQRGLENKVLIKGCLCDGECKNGPNIRINDRSFSHISPGVLEDILSHELGQEL